MVTQRTLWLESLPEWTWNSLDSKWVEFQNEMTKYTEVNKRSAYISIYVMVGIGTMKYMSYINMRATLRLKTYKTIQ